MPTHSHRRNIRREIAAKRAISTHHRQQYIIDHIDDMPETELNVFME